MSEPSSRLGFAIGLLVGVPMLAVGVIGVLDNAPSTHPAELARWVLGAALVHDLVVLPIVAVASTLVWRALPTRVRMPVGWALATTAVVAVVSSPFVRGYGLRPGNESLLPRDHGSATLAALAVVWVTAGIWTVIRRPLDAGDRRRRPWSRPAPR